MTTAYLKLSLIASLLALAGCSSTPSQPKISQLHNEVGKLNKEMRQLTRQASALEQQGHLNSGAAQGAWLLPAAGTGVILKSQAGDLKLSLSHVQAEANGTRASLDIHATGDAPLPSFIAEVEWGELDSATGQPLSISSMSQKIEVASALLPRGQVSVPLRLSNLSPDRLGYVRIHDVVVTPPTPAETRP
ncbi:DUF3251 domain-containing protein [Erwinia sp. SLM-02]|uniref:DUF3251 domain-containing protein n=1 Tax=Erwinia sp. SLM-02 TaxID=3020057 RepID=UPI0028D91163|nr:DUF3251 domain-containing protein [uncultured Erwinia sp.]